MSEYQLPENFKPVSLQDIFNAAWQAFVVEDSPPAKKDGVCRYLTEDGCKCVVGLCIPDGHPAQRSLMAFGSITDDYPELWAADVLALTYGARNTFQRSLHDHLTREGGMGWAVGRDEREVRYREIAAEYNLTIPGESL